MTDERDKRDGDQNPEDELYSSVEDSGVHRLLRVYDEAMPRHEGRLVPAATAEEINKVVEQKLALQEIYGIRKKIRDDLRSVTERTPWLAGVLGVENIPKISAQQISDEEGARRVRRMCKFAKKDTGVHPLTVHTEVATLELKKEQNVMEAEEYGKYILGKNRGLLEAGDYKKWRNVMLKLRYKFSTEREKTAFYDVIQNAAEVAFAKILEGKDPQRMVNGFIYLGGISLFKPEDLVDVSKETFTNPQVKAAFLGMLTGLLDSHPDLFFKVRAHLLELGFFQNKKEIDGWLEIVTKAKKTLMSAMNFDQGLFMRYRNLCQDHGFSLNLSEEEEMQIFEPLFVRLRRAALQSPGKYMALRKQLKHLEIMDEETADGDDEVKWALLGHRLQWEKIHPWALSKLRNYWQTSGLHVINEVQPEDFADHSNEELRKDPCRSVPIGCAPLPRGTDTEITAQRALNYFEYEKEKYEEFDKEIEQLSMDYLDVDAEKIRVLHAKFPQYYEKSGKGYDTYKLES